jgi:hypothetical protein
MKITDFAVEVTKIEGKKKQVNIAQIKEILKVINILTDGEFYKSIRKLGKETVHQRGVLYHIIMEHKLKK